MSVTHEMLTILACTVLMSALPFFWPAMRKKSPVFFLLGTGALLSILVFDLIPDLFKIGGSSSLLYAAVVWALYSLVHLYHTRKYESSDLPDKTPTLFLSAMVAHSIASGVLLVASAHLTKGVNKSVYWALISHKAYESLIVASLVLQRMRNRLQAIIPVTIYALALPIGVVFASSYDSLLRYSVSLYITSFAVGALLACLVYDLFLPSLAHVKARKSNSVWLIVGFFLTQFLLGFKLY